MTTKNFKELAAGVFFTCATVLMLLASYVVYTEWQVYWSKGFADFRSISGAIVSLERTTLPVSVMAPDMLEQIHAILNEMKEMNRSLGGMERSVTNMGTAVQGLELSIRGMSYTVPQGMGEMRRQISPWNMMNPFK